MRYHGGKARVARHLAPFIQEALLKTRGRLLEPFVGGFNIVPALGHYARRVVCSDRNPGLISLYRAVRGGWFPPAIDRELYYRLKAWGNWMNPATSFAAYGCSYAGKEWGGFAAGEERNYAAEARRALARKVSHMYKVTFLCRDYRDLAPRGNLWTIYCDPPYAGTTDYGIVFDSPRFHRWCEARAAEGHTVLVSELEAPRHWNVLWEAERPIYMARTAYARKVERLYMAQSQG